MKTSMIALNVLVLSTVSAFPQGNVGVAAGSISGGAAAASGAVGANLNSNLGANLNPSFGTNLNPSLGANLNPSFETNPRPNVDVPSAEPAQSATRTLRNSVWAVYRYQSLTLKETTKVTPHDDGTHSVRADFNVQGEGVSIRCVSPIREVVVAFIEYINSIFRNGSTRTDWSLEDIVRVARRDIMSRYNLSANQMTVTYIDQFNSTHVVEISFDRSGAKFASR